MGHGDQRHLVPLGEHDEILERGEVVPVGLGQPNDDVVLVVPRTVGGSLDALDRAAERASDLGGRESVQRRALAVHAHRQLRPRLIQIALQTDEPAGDWRVSKDLENSVGEPLQLLRVRSYHLDVHGWSAWRPLLHHLGSNLRTGNVGPHLLLHISQGLECVVAAILEIDQGKGDTSLILARGSPSPTHYVRAGAPAPATAGGGDDRLHVLDPGDPTHLFFQHPGHGLGERHSGSDRRLRVHEDLGRRNVLGEELDAVVEDGEDPEGPNEEHRAGGEHGRPMIQHPAQTRLVPA